MLKRYSWSSFFMMYTSLHMTSISYTCSVIFCRKSFNRLKHLYKHIHKQNDSAHEWLAEQRWSKDLMIALEFKQWCVFNFFVEQDVLSWVSAILISDIMLAISAKVFSSSVLISFFCIMNELSVQCQTSFHSQVKDSRTVFILTLINLTWLIWACSILMINIFVKIFLLQLSHLQRCLIIFLQLDM